MEAPTQAPSSPLVSGYLTAPISSATEVAPGATTRARMRRSELTAGYSLPFWFRLDGLKSSVGGALAASIAAFAWASRSAAVGGAGGAWAIPESPDNTVM